MIIFCRSSQQNAFDVSSIARFMQWGGRETRRLHDFIRIHSEGHEIERNAAESSRKTLGKNSFFFSVFVFSKHERFCLWSLIPLSPYFLTEIIHSVSILDVVPGNTNTSLDRKTDQRDTISLDSRPLASHSLLNSLIYTPHQATRWANGITQNRKAK
jgi:hypothetical protein